MTATASTLTKSHRAAAFSSFNAEQIDVIARELSKIERAEGSVRVTRVLELAREKDHPLHPFVFALSDREAAEQHRLDVVRRMCRAVRVIWKDDAGAEKANLPMLVSVRVQSSTERDEDAESELIERAYISSERAMADPEQKQALLDEAIRQAEYWKDRYRTLSELAPVFHAISRVKRRKAKMS